ncbi:hypothetical protein [Nocardia mexicana]|uniref:hypothetical protein n=2 Tax=Nocardia mexicana TaxID=279262 RepID=UPI0014774AD0|nr:hypothetical protein [Nocardia mexicana]
MRSVAVTTALTGLLAAGAVGPAAAEPLPPECTQSDNHVTCVYTGNQQLDGGYGRGTFLPLPASVTRVHIEAIGAPGADSCCHTVAPGGRGARVGGDVTVPPGARLIARVAEGEGSQGGRTRAVPGADPAAEPNVMGGNGGGISSVRLDSGVITPPSTVPGTTELATAAGGGGGAASWDGQQSPGGDAGLPGAGARGGAAGGPATPLAPGGGKDVFNGSISHPGGDGGPGYGGSGGGGLTGTGAVGGGGGGGAGWRGGGGGAIGGQGDDGRGDPAVPPGGGGGGASLIPPGGTTDLVERDVQPQVVISFDLPA